MANITIKHILDIIADQIQDEAHALWEVEDLLNWYNIGTRTIVTIDPRANAVKQTVKLSAGVKQMIPAGGITLLGVLRNMGADGLTPGKSVYATTIAALMSFNPAWSSDTATVAISNFAPDPGNAAAYFNYPPSDGTGYVEIEYSKVPTIITYDEDGDWESAYIGIQEGYIDPLMNYIMYRGYGKDTDIPGNDAKSQKYFALFTQGIGVGGR